MIEEQLNIVSNFSRKKKKKQTETNDTEIVVGKCQVLCNYGRSKQSDIILRLEKTLRHTISTRNEFEPF